MAARGILWCHWCDSAPLLNGSTAVTPDGSTNGVAANIYTAYKVSTPNHVVVS
jgi:hypothetical protein